MEPEEAEDVRRLLTYAEDTAGGMMTPEPVILPPDATVADALAHVRNAELTPSLAAMVYVCRPPLETPTGRFLGVGPLPAAAARAAVDAGRGRARHRARRRSRAEATLRRGRRATSRRTTWSRRPWSTRTGRLLGAVTVDDVLDHLLPEDWRDQREPVPGA